jgi:mono/diheme cytochrome c family protein
MQHLRRSLPLMVALAILLGAALFASPMRPALAVESDPVPQPQDSEMMASGYGSMLGYGRAATEEDIAAWDIDVRADGTGAPEGSGTVAEGAELYAQHCARCHSADGRESQYLLLLNRTLVGEYDPDNWPQTPMTIGNYWPHASSVFDFVRRAMPYDTPGILSDDEVYAITAWLLNQNGIIDDDTVLDAELLGSIEMPAAEHWVEGDLRDIYPYR